jgi:hypothetical protein
MPVSNDASEHIIFVYHDVLATAGSGLLIRQKYIKS